MSYLITIPTYGRYKLIHETTLKLLNEIGYNKLVHIFVDNEEEFDKYIEEFSKYDYSFHCDIIVTNNNGIGNCRNFIRNYYETGQKIIMIDDDIIDIRSIGNNFRILDWFDEVFKTMKLEKVKFAGATPYDNEFYMKLGYTTTLKYTGAHLIFEIIRTKKHRLHLDINHFEDYLTNLYYFILDRKLLRFNSIYVKTKYFNKNGGIIASEGSIENRMKKSEETANKLVVIFQNLVLKSWSKKYKCINLKFCRLKDFNEKWFKYIENYYNYDSKKSQIVESFN